MGKGCRTHLSPLHIPGGFRSRRDQPCLRPSSLASCHHVPGDSQSQEGVRCHQGWQMVKEPQLLPLKRE